MAEQPETQPPPARKTTITTLHEQRGIILSILEDFLDEDAIERMFQWFDHVGFDIVALRDPHDLGAAWLGHYRRGRGYDMDRVFNDYLTWPPIAQRIAFLTKQSDGHVRVRCREQRMAHICLCADACALMSISAIYRIGMHPKVSCILCELAHGSNGV